jgi:hypothetical protein
MLLEPPWRNLSLADAAQNWQRRRMMSRVFESSFGKCNQITGQNFGAGT